MKLIKTFTLALACSLVFSACGKSVATQVEMASSTQSESKMSSAGKSVESVHVSTKGVPALFELFATSTEHSWTEYQELKEVKFDGKQSKGANGMINQRVTFKLSGYPNELLPAGWDKNGQSKAAVANLGNGFMFLNGDANSVKSIDVNLLYTGDYTKTFKQLLPLETKYKLLANRCAEESSEYADTAFFELTTNGSEPYYAKATTNIGGTSQNPGGSEFEFSKSSFDAKIGEMNCKKIN